MQNLHLYALIETNDGHIFDVSGVSNDVFTVQRGGIAAVVSETAVTDYAILPQPDLMQYLVGHQRVVEHLLAEFDVLPVKFGTVLPSEQVVRQMLGQKRPLFQKAFEQVRGLVQMEIVVLWSAQAEIATIAEALDIPRLQTALVGKLAEEVQAAQVEIGKKIHAGLAERRATVAHQLLPALESLSLGLVQNPLLNDDMVMNVALLLDEVGQTKLDGTLAKLDRLTNGAFTIRCVGPLPAHSFATVSISLPNDALLKQAHQLLQLGESATKREIKRTYRKLASKVHPDLQGSAEEMQVLSNAYWLLMQYADNQTDSNIQFDEEARRATIYVTVDTPQGDLMRVQQEEAA